MQEVARAVDAAWRLELFDPEMSKSTREIRQLEYRVALMKLENAAPQLELRVDDLVAGQPASAQVTKCGPCGIGRLPTHPWTLWEESLGFGWELVLCR